jgi:hypothetical protein
LAKAPKLNIRLMETPSFSPLFDYFARQYEAVQTVAEADVFQTSLEIANHLSEHFGLDVLPADVYKELSALGFQTHTFDSGRITWLLRKW